MKKGLFRLVWRFNAIAIAAVSAIALFFGSYAAFQLARDLLRPYRAQGVVRVGDTGGSRKPAPASTLHTSHFLHIRGTPILWSSINAQQTYEFRYSSKEASSTRNVLFYDMTSGESRRLLPDHEHLVTDRRELRSAEDNQGEAPKALLFALVEDDTNQDGVLSSQDTATVALSRTDGSDLVRVAGARGFLHGATITPDGSQVVLMVENAGAIQAIHVDLATFGVGRTAAIVP